MPTNDELSILRRRIEDMETRADSIRPARRTPPGRYVGVVYDGGSIPTSGVGKYHLTHPVHVAGTETEGGSGTLTTETGQSVVVLVVDGPCAAGDYVVARLVNGRWVVEKGRGAGGGGSGSLPGCVCSAPPATLTMTCVGPCTDGRWFDCTIQYGATPPSLLSLLPANSYLSTATFPDPGTGDLFDYYVGCFSSNIRIDRVFPTSSFGSPFLDPGIYLWAFGFPGNTCSPFLLSNGTLIGGIPDCTVTISE